MATKEAKPGAAKPRELLLTLSRNDVREACSDGAERTLGEIAQRLLPLVSPEVAVRMLVNKPRYSGLPVEDKIKRGVILMTSKIVTEMTSCGVLVKRTEGSKDLFRLPKADAKPVSRKVTWRGPSKTNITRDVGGGKRVDFGFSSADLFEVCKGLQRKNIQITGAALLDVMRPKLSLADCRAYAKQCQHKNRAKKGPCSHLDKLSDEGVLRWTIESLMRPLVMYDHLPMEKKTTVVFEFKPWVAV